MFVVTGFSGTLSAPVLFHGRFTSLDRRSPARLPARKGRPASVSSEIRIGRRPWRPRNHLRRSAAAGFRCGVVGSLRFLGSGILDRSVIRRRVLRFLVLGSKRPRRSSASFLVARCRSDASAAGRAWRHGAASTLYGFNLLVPGWISQAVAASRNRRTLQGPGLARICFTHWLGRCGPDSALLIGRFGRGPGASLSAQRQFLGLDSRHLTRLRPHQSRQGLGLSPLSFPLP